MVENVSRFTKGMVVVVTDKDDPLFEKQGEIVSIHDDGHEEGQIEVSIEELRRRHSYMSDDVREMLGYHFKFRFYPDQLKKSEWSIQTRAKRIFNSTFLIIQKLKIDFDPANECHVANCTNLQRNKSLINFSGTVIEYYFCDQCDERWHGKLKETLPEIEI